MGETEAEKEFLKGVKAFRDGNSLTALSCFEKAAGLGTRPVYSSYFGFSIARHRGQTQKGILLCREAIEEEPENGVHYLNLGRIHIGMGNKQEAMRVFRQGLALGPNEEIVELLVAMGARKPPVIPFLNRNNPINKYLGKILGRLGLR